MSKDRVLYQVGVPDNMRNVVDDTPEEYRVVVPDGVTIACIIYGRYGRQWHANCSPRWLVRHLLEALMDTMQKERIADARARKLATTVRNMIEYMPTYEGEKHCDTGSITLELAQRLLREIGE